jgi:hypothetical protein
MKIFFPLSYFIRKFRGRIFRIKVKITSQLFNEPFKIRTSAPVFQSAGVLLHTDSFPDCCNVYRAGEQSANPFMSLTTELQSSSDSLIPGYTSQFYRFRQTAFHFIRKIRFTPVLLAIIKQDLITFPVSCPDIRYQNPVKGNKNS